MNSAPNPSPTIATRIGLSLAIDGFLESRESDGEGLAEPCRIVGRDGKASTWRGDDDGDDGRTAGPGSLHRERGGERLSPRAGAPARPTGRAGRRSATPTPTCSSGARRNGASRCHDRPRGDLPSRRRRRRRSSPRRTSPTGRSRWRRRGPGKHIMCEKPLGLSRARSATMYEAARDAGVVHMTAFTYRFAPSMRYLRHLLKSGALGTPRHFRSQRFLDWPETSWGWRQYKDKAGAGDLYDMTIHRIDFAIDLLGPIARVCGAVARFAPRDQTPDGSACPPSEVDDWSCLIGEFADGRHRRLGGDDPGQGLPPRRLRPRVGRDQRLGGLGRLPAPRAEHDPARQDGPRPGPGGRPRRVPQAGRQPPRPAPRASRPPSSATTSSGSSSRRSSRTAPGRPQLPRRPQCPDRRRRRPRVARAADLGRNPRRACVRRLIPGGS